MNFRVRFGRKSEISFAQVHHFFPNEHPKSPSFHEETTFPVGMMASLTFLYDALGFGLVHVQF